MTRQSISISRLFQSTPSVGRATWELFENYRIAKISIHALRGEGDLVFSALPCFAVISIHALRGEGDVQMTRTVRSKNISIHALRGEGDNGTSFINKYNRIFQSTPSVGRATNTIEIQSIEDDISIHALRGEGDGSSS